ncbi:MAG: hypothetical protein GYB25_06505 [Rhodobacteraceae bacterium]|nr:hypothetical protein [Paracoccaceae bacterium]
MSAALDTRLLAAHETGDRRSLVALYREAAEGANADEARGFYLTHAYVYALEEGHPMARDLHALLCAMGREE